MSSPQHRPTAPSKSVMARVPIAGMRKNVVPSVPTIEPAVETPYTAPETVPEC